MDIIIFIIGAIVIMVILAPLFAANKQESLPVISRKPQEITQLQKNYNYNNYAISVAEDIIEESINYIENSSYGFQAESHFLIADRFLEELRGKIKYCENVNLIFEKIDKLKERLEEVYYSFACEDELKPVLITRNEQVINENIAIISSTNNIETMEGRYKHIIFLHDLILKTAKSHSLEIKIDPAFLLKLDENFNNNLIRILQFKKEEYRDKINSLKRLKAIDNRTEEIFNLLEDSKIMIKSTYDMLLINKKIDQIYYDVQEIYSNRTLNF